MSNQGRQKPGETSNPRKAKRSKKTAQGPVGEAQAAPELIEATSTSVEPEIAPKAAETVTAIEAALAEPVVRVASFRERMGSVMPPAPIASVKPAAPDETEEASQVPATGIQAIANAYRDYARKSLEDAQSFAQKLTAARSLDKAVEAQTEFTRQACETFADNSRKIRTLYRELFWQAFRFPSWPSGRTPR